MNEFSNNQILTDSCQKLFFQPLSDELTSCGVKLAGIIDLMTSKYPQKSRDPYYYELMIDIKLLIQFTASRDLEYNLKELEQVLKDKLYLNITTKSISESHQLIIASVKQSNTSWLPSFFYLRPGPMSHPLGVANQLCKKYSQEDSLFSQLYNQFYHLSTTKSARSLSTLVSFLQSWVRVKECYLVKNSDTMEVLEIATNKTDKWNKARTQ